MQQKNSKECTSYIEETVPFAELNVVMRSKFLDKIDDLSTDAEASDINSQAEFSSIAVPRVDKHKAKDATNALDPGWTDPWSSEPWKNGKWPETPNNNQSRIDTSFDSLQFTPVIKTSGENTSSELFGFVDAFGAPFASTDIPAVATNNAGIASLKRDTKSKSPPNHLKESKINVGIVVKERLSILYDEAKNEPSCKVTGDIYVKPTNRKLNSFALTVRDSRDNVENWDERNRRCRNITAAVPHLALDPSDQVFSISMKRNHQNELGLEYPVVSYSCIPRLRPMPLLLKTKVHHRRDRCRLGVRIRANPQNTSALKDLVVLIIVPLGWDGNNVTMSRRGGIWNDLKRSLLWNIRTVDPGETIDIQAQFKTTNPERGASEESQKFPVMARCKGDANFSKITLDTDFREDGSHPVGIDLERSTTILYRKI